MEWDDLKHFLAVARWGNLTEAARELKATAATVGRHIAALEDRLGARLFEHRTTGYVLTEIGRSIRVHAEDAEAAVLAAERGVLGTDLRLAGKVRVATTEDLATMVIVPSLPDFHVRNPGISIEIVAGTGLASLTRRDADVALRTARPDKGDLLVRRVGTVDLGVYASRSYVAAHGIEPGNTSFEDVEIITWIEEMANFRGGAWLAEKAAAAAVALRVNSTRALFDACRAGLGLAVLPCFGADGDPDLVCVMPPEQVLSFDAWVVLHRDLARAARVRAVADFLASLGPNLGRRRSAPGFVEADWH